MTKLAPAENRTNYGTASESKTETQSYVVPDKEYGEITALTTEDFGVSNSEMAKISAGLLFTLNPTDQAKLIKKYVPDADIKQDKEGKYLVQIGDNLAYINKPGFSTIDANTALMQVLAYLPSAKLATMGANLFTKMLAGASSAGLTSVTNDAVAKLFSKETGISPQRASLAFAGGAIAELIAPLVGGASNLIRRRGALKKESSIEKAEASLPQGETLSDTVLAPSEMDADQLAQLRYEEAVRPTTKDPLATAESLSDQIEFEIPYTVGQQQARVTAPGEPGIDFPPSKQLYGEEAVLSGARGDKPQKNLNQLREAQREAVDAGIASTASRLGGDVPAHEGDAGQSLLTNIKEAEQGMGRSVQTAYEQVPEESFVQPRAFENLLRFIDDELTGSQAQRLAQGQPEYGAVFLASSGTDSQARKALTYIEELTEKVDEVGVAPNFGWIEVGRKQLGKYIDDATPGSADKREAILIKKGYDKWVDDLVDNALIEGDDTVLDALKYARELSGAYFKTFASTSTKDPVGRLIRKMIEQDDYSGDQALKTIIGVGKAGKGAHASAIVKRLRKVFGTDPSTGKFDERILATSEGWQNLRQSYFLRLVNTARGGSNSGTPVSGAKFKKAVADLLFGDGRAISRALYNDKERGMITRLARAILRTQPPKQNPSGSGWVASQETGKLLGRVGFMLGLGTEAIIASSAIKGGAKALFPKRGAKFSGSRRLPPLTIPRAVATSQSAMAPENIDALNETQFNAPLLN